MQVLTRAWGKFHYRVEGPEDAPAVVFANSLGTDLRLWDALLPLLPPGLRIVRFDNRGSGLSDLGGSWSIEDHADDVAALIRQETRTPVVMVGLSLGGLLAQVVASEHPQLLRAVVLSNTATKLGTAESWTARIAEIEKDGIEGIADMVMERWFAPPFRTTPQLSVWRNMMVRCSVPGYIAACRALSVADRTAQTARLGLPALVISGSEDGASPAELVKATASLIPRAEYHCIPGAGHIPCVENPAAYAAILNPFLKANLYV